MELTASTAERSFVSPWMPFWIAACQFRRLLLIIILNELVYSFILRNWEFAKMLWLIINVDFKQIVFFSVHRHHTFQDSARGIWVIKIKMKCFWRHKKPWVRTGTHKVGFTIHHLGARLPACEQCFLLVIPSWKETLLANRPWELKRARFVAKSTPWSPSLWFVLFIMYPVSRFEFSLSLWRLCIYTSAFLVSVNQPSPPQVTKWQCVLSCVLKFFNCAREYLVGSLNETSFCFGNIREIALLLFNWSIEYFNINEVLFVDSCFDWGSSKGRKGESVFGIKMLVFWFFKVSFIVSQPNILVLKSETRTSLGVFHLWELSRCYPISTFFLHLFYFRIRFCCDHARVSCLGLLSCLFEWYVAGIGFICFFFLIIESSCCDPVGVSFDLGW